jgi:hypothetical protein
MVFVPERGAAGYRRSFAGAEPPVPPRATVEVLASGGRDIEFISTFFGKLLVNHDGGARGHGPTRKDRHSSSR